MLVASRQLIIVTQCFAEIQQKLPLKTIPHLAANTHLAQQSNITLFSNAKRFLGQEFPCAIYDMQAENGVAFHLDAFAILAGTIQANGVLLLFCPQWHNLTAQIDRDSHRWNNQTVIKTPHFFQYFQTLVAEFAWKIDPPLTIFDQISGANPPKICKPSLTEEQQHIFTQLPSDSHNIHSITAARGRGKSTLAGKLAEQISQTQPTLLTARSQKALSQVWQTVTPQKIPFCAPDLLITQINQQAISPQQWLFVDEAATLPLPMLITFCQFFEKVVLITTTQNYEGTGRGFELKLQSQLPYPIKKWTLTTPLRWHKEDKLERFVQRLLLLDDSPLSQDPHHLDHFYQLLANAHYKTTPTDLRRLFDAHDQYYDKLIIDQKLVGGLWAVYEGGLDDELIQSIWRGERRPHGNLVAQYLCFQSNLPQACRLRSLRISRIAVTPDQQGQGFGKRLISRLILQMRTQQQIDFLSVSFGLNNALFQFWQDCGFSLVQLSTKPEASSGLYSAMMLLPLTEQGQRFTETAITRFEQDLPLLPLPSALQNLPQISPLIHIKADNCFTAQDASNLQGFMEAQRSLSACYASIVRLCHTTKHPLCAQILQQLSYSLNKSEQQQLKESLALLLVANQFQSKQGNNA